MKEEKFKVITNDDVILRGSLLVPEKPKAVVQFNCGTAAKKELYKGLLTYLTDQGYLCCLWDYRGSGESLSGSLKGCDYLFSDYGIKDMPAIKIFLENEYPHLPFFFVAHSAGGQQIGFINNLDNVKGAVNIAVSAGYYPNMPLGYRIKAYFFFYIFAPLSISLNGFVNAKKYGFMENLPKNVAIQWREWCARKDYFFDKRFYGKSVPTGNFKNYDFPIRVFWTVDDTISNKKNTENYWKHVYSSKGIDFTRITPKEYGLKKIDHFGFFKKIMKDKLWVQIAAQLDDWLED